MKNMKHLKAFEELDRDTYFNAANKLDRFGHNKRAENIRKHASQIKHNEEEFSYYTSSTYTSVVNPIMKNDTIAKMKIELTKDIKHTEPKRSIMNRIKGDNKDIVSEHIGDIYKLVVTMSKGDVFDFEICNIKFLEFFFGPKEIIQFKDRKEAYKFVKMCNNFIREEIGKTIPINAEVNTLNVNDFYKE